MTEFNNASQHEFVDISSEAYRLYTFSTGFKVRIENPLWLSVSASGGHRLFDGAGTSHYIPTGWCHLEWRAREGQPNFVA